MRPLQLNIICFLVIYGIKTTNSFTYSLDHVNSFGDNSNLVSIENAIPPLDANAVETAFDKISDNSIRKTIYKNLTERKDEASKECKCNDTEYSEILVIKRQPVKCACMIKGYEADEAPGENDYTTIYNKFESISVLNIREEQKTVAVNIILSYKWEDPRINATSQENMNEISFAGVSPRKKLSVWQPSRSSYLSDNNDEMTFENIGFLLDDSLNGNGTVLRAVLSWRLTLMCDLNFEWFPFDNHSCKFRLNSKDSGNLREVLYEHENQMTMELPNFNSFSVVAKMIGSHDNDRNYSKHIGFDIEMMRQTEPYMFEYYIPSIIIVCIASISFIIPVTAIPGRVGLVVTLLLTHINLFTNQQVSF